ncbi:MAG: cyclin family protein [Candidatus Thorarchaeota archaeon]
MSHWDTKEGLIIVAKYPATLDINTDQFSMMFYSCAPEESLTTFQVFPQKDVTERAAVACSQSLREGVQDDICVTALLTAEEEGSAYENILNSTLQRLIKISRDSTNRKRRYRQILSDSYRKIERRGGSRDRSLCPYKYERPIKDDELTSFCRVVKKRCYLTIYEMPGYPQCPRYIRRQRQIQLANARQLVRTGIQHILEEYDEERKQSKTTKPGTWGEPIHEIMDRLFSILELKPETEEFAHNIVEYISKEGYFQGHPRPIIAASIAYYSAKQTGDSLPENDIIELVGCSRTSLRRNFRELRIALGSDEKKLPQHKRQQRRTTSKEKAITRAE